MARKSKSLEVWCHENSKNDLLDEWNNEKNMALMSPRQTSKIEYNTPLSAYWKCHEGHEWESRVAARTIFNLKCPTCNPEMASLPIGTKYGCLTIIGGVEEYEKWIAYRVIAGKGRDFYKTEKRYKCQCKCGHIKYLDEFQFLEKKHRYCDGEVLGECGLKKKHDQNKLESYNRVYDESYNIDYSNTIHESLEILECVDDNYEQLYRHYDRRKKGSGTFKVYKLYKCRCYLCGKEQTIKSSEFSINPPTQYGYDAYNGYFSKAYCGCHETSSFQWIVTKILSENNVPYRVEFSFPGLYGAMRVNLLRYDFAVLNTNGSIKCLIECQGEQHFKPVDEFGGKSQFVFQKVNDDLKRTYADEHGILLYEIPYTSKKYEKVESFLKSKMIIQDLQNIK